MGFGVWGLGFRAQGLGLRVKVYKFGVEGQRVRDKGSGIGD